MKSGYAVRMLAIAGLVVAPTLARADAPMTLKFGFPAPTGGSNFYSQGIVPWIHSVEKASGGTLQIKMYTGPTLGTFRNIYERTLSNVAQISFGVFGPYPGQFPLTNVVTLPFLSDDTTNSSVALWRLYTRGLLGPAYKNVKVLALFNFAGLTNINTNKPIKTIANLSGMKIGVADRAEAETIAALGASPVSLTPSELYQGMSRGLVQGTIMSSTGNKAFHLNEVTKYHLAAPLGQGDAFIFMNKAAYAALPPKAKHAIEEYSGEPFSKTLGAANEAENLDQAKKVAAEPGQFVSKLSPAQYKTWKARVQPVIASWAKHTPGGAKVLAAYREELKKIRMARQ